MIRFIATSVVTAIVTLVFSNLYHRKAISKLNHRNRHYQPYVPDPNRKVISLNPFQYLIIYTEGNVDFVNLDDHHDLTDYEIETAEYDPESEFLSCLKHLTHD
jgi:hypothetical protein